MALDILEDKDLKFNLAISLSATPTDCEYKLEFTASNTGESPLNPVEFTYMLANNFEWVSPLGDTNFDESHWKLQGALTAGDLETKTVIIRYTGTTSITNAVIFSDINGTARHGNDAADYTGIFEYKQDVKPCVVIKPEFDLSITYAALADCKYRLDFKVTNKSTQTVKDILITYALNTNNFEWVTPPDSETQWDVGDLAPNASKTQTAVIQFIGTTTGAKVVFPDIDATSTNGKFDGIDHLSIDVDTACQTTPECCEDCPETSGLIVFNACDQSLTATIEPSLTSEGKELKVHVKLNPVCLSKHVVVGIELHEVTSMDPLTTVRRALKVIDLTPAQEDDACGPRECNCATFYIPPKDPASTDPTCDTQTFIVKAKAHYYYLDDTDPACECSACSID